MTFIEAVIGFFKFFDQVTALIKILKKTPEEKHQDILNAMNAEAKKIAQTARPDWD